MILFRFLIKTAKWLCKSTAGFYLFDLFIFCRELEPDAAAVCRLDLYNHSVNHVSGFLALVSNIKLIIFNTAFVLSLWKAPVWDSFGPLFHTVEQTHIFFKAEEKRTVCFCWAVVLVFTSIPHVFDMQMLVSQFWQPNTGTFVKQQQQLYDR